MKTYLVTGGAGFIGSNFVIYLLNKYEDIKVINSKGKESKMNLLAKI